MTAYDDAQVAEARLFDVLLLDLIRTVPEPVQTRGRPRVPLHDALFCTVKKVATQVSARRAAGHWLDHVEKQHISRAPSFILPSRFLRQPDLTPLMSDLLATSALPLAALEGVFAVDSSGFRTTQFGAYRSERYGAPRKNVWLKAHILVGTRTHVIAQAIITDGTGEGTGDSTHLPALVQRAHQAGFDLREVVADKAYSSRRNLLALKAIGAMPFIPYRANATGRTRGISGGLLWRKAWLYYQLHREEFHAHYRQRAQVEAVFSAIKRKLGETLRSRDRVAQENELLAKLIAYNITRLIDSMMRFGIEPSFTVPPRGRSTRAVSFDAFADARPPTPPGPAVEEAAEAEPEA